jgi:hypothetical protein
MHMQDLKDIAKLDADSLLGALGLQRSGVQSWIGPAAGGLAVGLVVGAAMAVLFAPSSGRDLRGELGRRLEGTKDEFKAAFKVGPANASSAEHRQV